MRQDPQVNVEVDLEVQDKIACMILRRSTEIIFFTSLSILQNPLLVGKPIPPRAIVLQAVPPEYTPEAQAAGLEGIVILYVEVGSSGLLEKAQVVQSLGLGLDQKALQAVFQWRFGPAIAEGVPVRVEQSVEVRFSLPSTSSSWLVRRSFYRADSSGLRVAKSVSDPIMIGYAKPDSGACTGNRESALVEFEITRTGAVKKVKSIKAPADLAEQAAIRAISSWTFEPGKKDGKSQDRHGVVEMECRPAESSATTPTAANDSNQVILSSAGDPGMSPPHLISSVEPAYSEQARNAKRVGKVILSIVIDRSGHTTNMLVTQSVGMGLDEKAMQAVSQWRFQPAMKDGAPVAIWATIEVSFRLV